MARRLAPLLVVASIAAPAGARPGAAGELLAAARRGDVARAAALLRAGADVDARDRELGTALDVAETQGRPELAALLRAHGARGSGKSVGDTVCVRPWAGSGLCGKVEARRRNQHRLTVLRIVGCESGCAPDAECSAGRPVGGTSSQAIRAGDELEVPSWCLTHTGVEPRR
jgi:hypothetical protein